jgi:hypothetical protein
MWLRVWCLQIPILSRAAGSISLFQAAHHSHARWLRSNSRRLVVYQDARHTFGACSSVNLEPYPPTMWPDWMAARFAGKPMSNERWYVDNSGAVTKTAL